MKHSHLSTLGLALATGLLLSPPTAAAVNIDWVDVGNVGNAADPATGSLYGAVAYEYKIAKNETTIAKYAAFLNAVATTDTYGLYNTNMATDGNIAGIQRIGTSGSYSYTVIGSGNRPITYVSWFDAARFCNWMHNGQPVGAQTALTTENGAYTLLGAMSGVGFTVQAGAKMWIPSESEWYKAAYYDPTKNAGAGGYWLHANQSDSMTSNDFTSAGAANFRAGDYATTPGNSFYSSSQNYLTDVGAYGADSESFYGTADQAGNVLEWNDAVISGSSRGMRAGAWDSSGEYLLRSSFRYDSTNPAVEYSTVGFRVASVPEPSALVLTVLFGAGLVCRRKR